VESGLLWNPSDLQGPRVVQNVPADFQIFNACLKSHNFQNVIFIGSESRFGVGLTWDARSIIFSIMEITRDRLSLFHPGLKKNLSENRSLNIPVPEQRRYQGGETEKARVYCSVC